MPAPLRDLGVVLSNETAQGRTCRLWTDLYID